MGLLTRSAASLLAATLAAAPVPAAAPPPAQPTPLERELRELPGFVDAAALGVYGDADDLTVEVNLFGPLIRFVAEAARGTEPELAEALGKIESFRFQLYRLPAAEVEPALRRLEGAAARLSTGGWQQVVQIREAGTRSYLHLKMEGERIIGLTVLFIDDEDQFGFINLAGEIDPAQIGRIGRRFDIDLLEEAEGEISQRAGRERP